MFSSNRKFLGFFSEESLSKKEGSVTLAKDAMNLARETSQCLLNPSLIIPFFWGPIYSQLPHVRSLNPFGHLHFTGEDADELTNAAQKTPNGIATFWAGPFPVLYVVSNDARHALVRESHVGIVDDAASNYLNWMSGGNNVMGTFPDFRPIDSETYQTQRRFLLQLFHGGAKQRLPEIEKATATFLQHYSEKQGNNPRPLREFITALVMYTSSHLLGLTQATLDTFYFEQPEYAWAIDRVAHYGISERADVALEKTLYTLFLQVLKRNFDNILNETADTNLIRNIFASMDVTFPQVFDDFEKLPGDIRHNIAMNFASTGLGAMVHSTANTLDWAIARLLKDRNKLVEFTELMAKHKDLDLTQEDIFDKGGPLFPLCEWVLHNVFLYPPFSHEFFLNQESYTATLSDGSTINVPSGSFTIVNYVQCNRSNEQMISLQTFSESLKKESTTGKFITDARVASFGGSINSKENRKSRICPGAKTSLYEQMIMMAMILRDYSLEFTDSKEISCDVDASKHPLCSRLNIGNVVLTKSLIKTPSDENLSMLNEEQIPEKEYTRVTNLNCFFNRAETALPLCDTNRQPFALRSA